MLSEIALNYNLLGYGLSQICIKVIMPALWRVTWQSFVSLLFYLKNYRREYVTFKVNFGFFVKKC